MATVLPATQETRFIGFKLGGQPHRLVGIPSNAKTIKDLKNIVQTAFNLQSTPVENIVLQFPDSFKYMRQTIFSDDMEIEQIKPSLGGQSLIQINIRRR